jgi:hypothetical protein
LTRISLHAAIGNDDDNQMRRSRAGGGAGVSKHPMDRTSDDWKAFVANVIAEAPGKS